MTELPIFRLPPWMCELMLKDLQAEFVHLPAHAPHGFTIGGESDPYLRRWFVTPRGDGPACYLHQFLRDDDDRALHDHPWASCGIILAGGYIEQLPTGAVERQAGDVIVREPEHRHRFILHRDAEGRPIPAWTLFLVGPRAREWGFWCLGHGKGERFVHWRDFTAGEHGEVIGKGCDA